MNTDDRNPDATPSPATGDHDPIHHYEIRVQGRLTARWSAWFDGFDVTADDDGTTVISGPVTDQAALHGVLHKVRDIGLTLISVTPVPPDAPTPGTPDERH